MDPELKELIARLAELMSKEPADRDQEAIAKCLADMDAYVKSDKAKGYAETKEFASQIAEIKAAHDKTVEELREVKRLGLRAHTGGIVTPRGLHERREMLRDGRAFLDDETAKRFGAYMVNETFKLWGMGERVPQYVREIADAVRKDMDPGVDASGGYLIPDEQRPEIIRNVEALGNLFIRCRRLPLATTGTTSIAKRTGGLTAYWTAAGAQGTRSTPTFDLVQLTPEKLMAIVAVPNEFLRSSVLIDLGNFIGVELSYAMSYALDDALVNGDASAAYGGITGILQSANISAVTAAATHTTVATLDGTDISNVIAGLTVGYALGEAEWGMSLSVKGKLRALKTTTGAPLYQRGNQREPSTIDDYPYQLSPRMPASGSIGAAELYAFFGNLRLSHIVGMVRDIEIARSEHALFESDMMAIRGTMHVDIQEADASAIVTAKTAAA